jgi:hypothetical protein
MRCYCEEIMKRFILTLRDSKTASAIGWIRERLACSSEEIKSERRRREQMQREFEAEQRVRLIARLRQITHHDNQSPQDLAA